MLNAECRMQPLAAGSLPSRLLRTGVCNLQMQNAECGMPNEGALFSAFGIQHSAFSIEAASFSSLLRHQHGVDHVHDPVGRGDVGLSNPGLDGTRNVS
jgi:hypothetical protein